MSYKLAPHHVLIAFIEQDVLPIHTHITVLHSDFPQYQEQKQLHRN